MKIANNTDPASGQKLPEQPQRDVWPNWLSPIDAAHYVNSSVSTLAKLRLRGGGPTFCRIGRAIRYRRADLDNWLSATARRSTSEADGVRS